MSVMIIIYDFVISCQVCAYFDFDKSVLHSILTPVTLTAAGPLYVRSARARLVPILRNAGKVSEHTALKS